LYLHALKNMFEYKYMEGINMSTVTKNVFDDASSHPADVRVSLVEKL
jgi:hypothetical protein